MRRPRTCFMVLLPLGEGTWPFPGYGEPFATARPILPYPAVAVSVDCPWHGIAGRECAGKGRFPGRAIMVRQRWVAGGAALGLLVLGLASWADQTALLGARSGLAEEQDELPVFSEPPGGLAEGGVVRDMIQAEVGTQSLNSARSWTRPR